MSPFLPQVTSRDLIRVVKQLGFELDRQKGGHAIFYRSSDNSRVVTPIHAGRDIKPKTLCSIIDEMGITPERFKELL
jgi:predicted RNA binding protein YcfA (HicA-like mRNA interferase family)